MDIKIEKTELLSDDAYPLRKVTYRYLDPGGRAQVQDREVYERGDAAVILLYNTEMKSVILTRQFRLPPFLRHAETMLTEACAGKLDGESPDAAVKRECLEETGYRVQTVQKVMEAYTSPACLTELMHFYIAPYDPAMKVAEGGGLEEEQEFIEVLEMPYEQALQLMRQGRIRDAKTIILLQYLRLHGIL